MSAEPAAQRHGVAVGGRLTFGADAPLVLIAGPCIVETPEFTLDVAKRLRDICAERSLPLVFKASFDKANRSSLSSFRGQGMEHGLEILARVGAELDLPTTTDVHLPDQAARVAEVVDLLQIPAFLCRQTDLLVAAAETGKPVNVKKGQFLAPEDMSNVVAKVTASGAGGVLLTERGTSFGYHTLINDMAGLVVMRNTGWPVVFDATHSVQKPGGLGTRSGGDRSRVEPLARAALAVGVDAVFMETHPDPEHAPSDGPNAVPLDALPALLDRLLTIDRARREVDGVGSGA